MPKAGLRTFLIFLNVVTVASSQTLAPKPLPKEPLEKYDNPPPLSAAVATSPGLISQFGPYTSYQVNVDASGNNIVGDAANEPSICVDPTDRNRISIGWRQFDNVSSNFRQAGFAYTANGGRTWIFPGVLQRNVFRSDPVLNSDSIGRFFYLSLLQNLFDDLWRSLNRGQSWTNIAAADGGDKQWFTIDNTNSTGRGFQYQFWSTDGNNYGGRQFSRSINGGLTWMNPINIPNSPAWGTLDVDSNGNLFIGGVNLSTNQIWCIQSTNSKNGAVVPTFDQRIAVQLGGHIAFGEPINPDGLVGQVFLAVDRSGTITNNNVYMLASIQPTGFSTGSDVMFVRSTNGGQTGESMQSGWTRVPLRTITTRSSSIHTASMAEIPGRAMLQPAIRLTRSLVIRIRTSSAITLQSSRTTQVPMSRMRRLLMVKKTSITSGSSHHHRTSATSVLGALCRRAPM